MTSDFFGQAVRVAAPSSNLKALVVEAPAKENARVLLARNLAILQRVHPSARLVGPIHGPHASEAEAVALLTKT